jgi:hypothetical protein
MMPTFSFFNKSPALLLLVSIFYYVREVSVYTYSIARVFPGQAQDSTKLIINPRDKKFFRQAGFLAVIPN